MSEVYMCLGAMAFILFGAMLIEALRYPSLRVGLWLIGINRKEADRIVEWQKTGKLPLDRLR